MITKGVFIMTAPPDDLPAESPLSRARPLVDSVFLVSAIVVGAVTAYWMFVSSPAYFDERANNLEHRESEIEEIKADLLVRQEALDDREAEVEQRLSDFSAQAEVLEAVLPAVDPEDPIPPPSRALSRRELHELWLRGYEAYKNGEFVLAREIFERVLVADPAYAPALNSLGRVAAELTGRGGAWVFRVPGSKAESFFRRAIEADPSYVPAIVNLGYAHFWRREYDVASEFATEALRIQPGFDAALRLQSSVAKRRNREDAAAGDPGAGGPR